MSGYPPLEGPYEYAVGSQTADPPYFSPAAYSPTPRGPAWILAIRRQRVRRPLSCGGGWSPLGDMA